nr:putative integron gene cassette protein [uncultured bacterium]
MRKTAEVLMYAAFAMAALPFAYIGVSDFLYFRAHPDALAGRDTAFQVVEIMAIFPFIRASLVIGCLFALYFVIMGPRILRIIGLVLIASWPLLFLVPPTLVQSSARLYCDGLPWVGLVMLPCACGVIRIVRSRRSDIA